MTLVEIGKTIRARRDAKGLTQEAFARVTGIARRTLTRLESGDPAVRIGTIEKVARALGLTLTVLSNGHHRPTLDQLDALYFDESSQTIQPRDAPHVTES